jgi:hypothetical protein
LRRERERLLLIAFKDDDAANALGQKIQKYNAPTAPA